MPMNPRTLRPGRTFTPRSIPGLALWLDAADSSTLFQDAAATIPATATNDPVGAWLDKSGNGRHATQATGASRPTISATAKNGRGNLTFNGTSGYFRCNSGAAFRARIAYAVVRRTGIPPAFSPIYAQRAVNSTVAANSEQEFYVSSRDGTGKLFGIVGAGGVMRVDGATVTPVNSGVSNLHEGDLLPNTTAFRAIAVQGNITDTIGTQIPFVGLDPFGLARTYPMQLCELLVYDSLLDAAKFRALERYLAAKWGITLAPQVSNADAQDWINRVYANGGTVSATTASAVNTFCDAITNAGIRDRFYRVNLFCGNSDGSLAAVRTPLFRGPSLGGTQYGGATDTNVNFGPGDYAETGASGGLKADGSSKHLDTGFSLASLPSAASRHISAYEIAKSANADDCSIGGTASSSSDGMALGTRNPATVYSWARGGPNDVVIASAPYSGGAHWIGQNNTLRAGQLYKNGVLDNSGTAVSDFTSTASNSITIFTWKITGGTPDPAFVFRSTARLGGYSIGTAFTAPQALAYYTAMQAFQAALGRQV